MTGHDSWIETTVEAIQARMRRLRSSNGVRRSELLADHYIEDCESITLGSFYRRYHRSENTRMNR
jgi:hypothetical protein